MTLAVTVVIPTIPEREAMYRRALASVGAQTLQPVETLVGMDEHRSEGAAGVRNRLLAMVTTPWVAFLDDDDELLPGHLATLAECQQVTGADVVYPWALRRYDDSPALPDEPFGRTFDPAAHPAVGGIPVTVLARTDMVRQALFGPAPDGTHYEDWGLFLRVHSLGARFARCEYITWIWHVHAGSTGGRAA